MGRKVKDELSLVLIDYIMNGTDSPFYRKRMFASNKLKTNS